MTDVTKAITYGAAIAVPVVTLLIVWLVVRKDDR
jgi:hypothetical protein